MVWVRRLPMCIGGGLDCYEARTWMLAWVAHVDPHPDLVSPTPLRVDRPAHAHQSHKLIQTTAITDIHIRLVRPVRTFKMAVMFSGFFSFSQHSLPPLPSLFVQNRTPLQFKTFPDHEVLVASCPGGSDHGIHPDEACCTYGKSPSSRERANAYAGGHARPCLRSWPAHHRKLVARQFREETM